MLDLPPYQPCQQTCSRCHHNIATQTWTVVQSVEVSGYQQPVYKETIMCCNCSKYKYQILRPCQPPSSRDSND
jgi:hypothetical protein